MAKVKNSKNEVKEQPIEQVLWAAADKLRKNMDAAEYKNVVLGLIFLNTYQTVFMIDLGYSNILLYDCCAAKDLVFNCETIPGLNHTCR